MFTDDGEDFEVEVQEDEEIMYPALDVGVDIPYHVKSADAACIP